MAMNPKYIQNEVMTGGQRLEIYGSPYGETRGHAHFENALAVGSNIPAGLFVVYSPIYANMEHGYCTERSVMLPDITGENLVHNDRKTTFADDIASVLKVDSFQFVGVTAYAGDTCKPDCTINECCPFGYPDDSPQWSNYYPRLTMARIVTQGPVKIYNETAVMMTDDLHVVVDQIDGMPCQYLGAVTNEAGANTRLLTIDYRIIEPATAGQGLWIELGRK